MRMKQPEHVMESPHLTRGHGRSGHLYVALYKHSLSELESLQPSRAFKATKRHLWFRDSTSLADVGLILMSGMQGAIRWLPDVQHGKAQRFKKSHKQISVLLELFWEPNPF